MSDTVSFVNASSSQVRQDFETQQHLLQSQPGLTQQFLQLQAQAIANALIQHQPNVRFTLPDEVISVAGGSTTYIVPADQREQIVGGLFDRLTRSDMRIILRQRLIELEQSPLPAISISAALIRHATALYMVRQMLPAGRRVTYVAAEGEEIPTIPLQKTQEVASAITAATDAIAEDSTTEDGRGELLVPYVAAARRFYLPQWVAFDEHDALLLQSLNEAEAQLASMEQFVHILHVAVNLAPYMVADEIYQEKRYGMLGQLINQGRALARYEVREIVQTIQRRAAANDLNRGLSLSLPFFDDQDLKMQHHDLEIIPAGRIMFVPSFVVRAAREELAKVAQDTRLSPSTRKHLMDVLRMLEEAFDVRK